MPWWLTPVIPARGRLSQEDPPDKFFKARLGYIVRPYLKKIKAGPGGS
jgi:hypothetical protein